MGSAEPVSKLDCLRVTRPMTSSENGQQLVHGTAVAIDNKGVLILGPSGSGKSDLSIQLIDRGAMLISDDQVITSRSSDGITLGPPENIAGKIEVYSLGIIEMPFVANIPLSMIVSLSEKPSRFPFDNPSRQYLGIDVPTITIDTNRATTAIKVELALRRIKNMTVEP